MLIDVIRGADDAQREELRYALGLLLSDRRDDPNWPLPNLRAVSEIDFWDWRSAWGFRGTIAHIIRVQIDGEWATVFVFYDDINRLRRGGFAVAYFYNARPQPRVSYFEWSRCAHEFRSKVLGNCWSRHTCEKCGESYEVDSSG